MTKSKTWEEEFLKTKFMSDGGARFECTDYEEMQVELRDFIASQIEKTRREAYDDGKAGRVSNPERMRIKIEYSQEGFKAGLQRAIELQPFINFNEVISNDVDSFMDGFEYSRSRYVENLKNELNK
jgi:hypothetical protein